MNIGLLIYDLRAGGAEHVLCKWSDLLSENHSVFLYTYDGASAPEYPYSGMLRVLDAPSKGKNKFKQLATLYSRCHLLKKQLKRDKIDLLISFCSTANFPTMFQRIPRIASIRLYDEYFSYRKIYRFLIKHTNTKLVVQTDRLRNDILSDVGEIYAAKILVIANPLDIQVIRRKMNDEPDKAFLEKIAKKQVVCFTASFKKSKNHWNLIKSFALVHQNMPDTVLVLIGGEGELEEKIHTMVEESPLKDSVIFVGKTNNPFAYEKYADVFVLPSLTEGIPNVLIEAMAVGLPVIATDCPSGPKEILCESPDLSVVTSGADLAEYGVLIQPFDEKIDFTLDNLSAQNKILAREIETMLIDSDRNAYYRGQSLLRSKDYDMDEYKKRLLQLIETATK